MAEVQEEQGSIGGSLLVFLLGVAVGATVAILYAPSSGAETRAQLAEKAEQLRIKAEELREKAGQIGEQVAGRAEEIKETVVTRLRRSEPESRPELAGEGASTGDAGSDGASGVATA
jgi:gas vesicle protein